MFENLPKNSHNDRILLPNSDREFELPDGRIVSPSFVLREATQELILACGYKRQNQTFRDTTDLQTILIPADAIKQIQTRGIGFKLFAGAFVDATFIFNRLYEARHLGEAGEVTFRNTDRFQMPLKDKDLKMLIARINLLNMNQ
jgi:hypothetical protein